MRLRERCHSSFHDCAILRNTLLARTASRCRRAYVLPLLLFFSFFLFRLLISEVTERISTKLGHTFTYDCYLKNLAWTSWTFTPPPWAGAKNRFWGPTLNRWNNGCNGTSNYAEHNNREETCQSTGTPLHAPNLVNFCPETAENGWRVFAHPYIFALGDTASLTAWTLYITESRQTLARVSLCSGTSLQSRTTECWAGSRWALPCIW